MTDEMVKDRTEKRIEKPSWVRLSFEEGGKAIALRAAGWSDEKICTTLSAIRKLDGEIAAALFLSKLSGDTPSQRNPGSEELHRNYGGGIKADSFEDRNTTFKSSSSTSETGLQQDSAKEPREGKHFRIIPYNPTRR